MVPPRSPSQLKIEAWRVDDTAECWLFIDSVDEARDQGLHFDVAVRILGDAIAGYEERTHIYISSRFTDWDATADRVSMEKWLAMPEPPPAPASDFEQDVRDTLHNKERPAPVDPKDPIAVLVMEPLDRHQVRCFAVGRGIGNADAFIAAVDHGNLWTFAARPLDLGWMVDYWRAKGRFGTLRQMIEASLTARLLDPDLRRRRRDPITPARDAFDADGDVVIPLDVENLGFWLKACFGAPTTAAAVAATGLITFSAQPAVNSTVTINGTVFFHGDRLVILVGRKHPPFEHTRQFGFLTPGEFDILAFGPVGGDQRRARSAGTSAPSSLACATSRTLAENAKLPVALISAH